MKVIYLEKAKRQLKKLDNSIRLRIMDYMDKIAALENPRSFGKELRHELKGLWRYRVGDFRILCKIQDDRLVITVVQVGHRREIYD